MMLWEIVLWISMIINLIAVIWAEYTVIRDCKKENDSIGTIISFMILTSFLFGMPLLIVGMIILMICFLMGYFTAPWEAFWSMEIDPMILSVTLIITGACLLISVCIGYVVSKFEKKECSCGKKNNRKAVYCGMCARKL